MAAETYRRNVKTSGLIVRPQAFSDKTYMESVVGFIHEVVPQAYSGSGKQEERETIQWVRFEYLDIEEFSIVSEEKYPPIFLILGFSNGIQIWAILANGEAQEVLSLRQGPVKTVRLLQTPENINRKDVMASKYPLIAMCDGTSAGQQYCAVNFTSLKMGDHIHCLKFKIPVVDIYYNRRVIVITFHEKISICDAMNFKLMFTIAGCYPCPGLQVNPIALGSAWLAFADKKLISVHQTCGGMAGNGVQSYAATVLHAAKTITKGLTIFGETVASSLTGHKSQLSVSKKDQKNAEHLQPGIVTILDIKAITRKEVNIDEDSDGEGIIAHFPAHANEPISALAFDPSGRLLFTACRLGHNFHIYCIFPHPASSTLGAVHHLYTLHRGDTTAKVQDITFSLDSRWVAVSTLRGTTHIFPITPYGGPISVRTHTSPRVVNRLSRFHKSAGLEESFSSPSTGRNSPVPSGSPTSTAVSMVRTCDSHPSVLYQTTVSGRMGNPRLPPYPHPLTISALAQVRQPHTFPLPSTSQSKNSPGKDRSGRRSSGSLDSMNVVAMFAPPRAWLVGSPNLARDKREKRPVDSLFVVGCQGYLIEYILEPRMPSGLGKVGEDSPIELDVTAHAQWNLFRLLNSMEIKPPLFSTNPLLAYEISSSNHAESNNQMQDSQAKGEEIEESWLSQVEIITHAGPHRRLWMGPQFTFKTFQHVANTTVLSPESSALLSQSPEIPHSSPLDIYTEELDIENLRTHPIRSSPMAMPSSHQSHSESPTLLLIEASSGSFEQSPGILEVFGDWPKTTETHTAKREHIEDQLKECLADAMQESSAKDKHLQAEITELHGSYEELSSSSSHSGSLNLTRSSSVHNLDHSLVFPASPGSFETT